MKQYKWQFAHCLSEAEMREFFAHPTDEQSLFILRGELIESLSDFLIQMDETFPHDTGLRANENWDALDDWLWSELMLMSESGISTVILVWKKFSHLHECSGLETLLLAIQFLHEIRNKLQGVDFVLYLIEDK